MEKHYQSEKFKKWLDNLQQESWQLELIISGFALFALYSSFEPFIELISKIQDRINGSDFQNIIGILSAAIVLSLAILFINLSVHIILRGLWIGAIGLRYVSGDIDFEHLKYSDKFTQYLKRKIGSFDKYISRLEDYCSVIFSISFLLTFIFISFFFSIAIVLLMITFFEEIGLESKYFKIPFTIILGLFYLLTAIDFFGQGILKRYKWPAKIYFPVYWVMSKISLSFLYRPLLYNFLDNKFGKRILGFLLPIYLVIFFLTSIRYVESNYLNQLFTRETNFTQQKFYEENSEEDYQIIGTVSIPNKVIEYSYLPIFIRYKPYMEETAFHFDESLKPSEEVMGWTIANGGPVNVNDLDRDTILTSKNFKSFLKIINDFTVIKIDSITIDHELSVTKNSKNQLGLETYIDLKNMTRGKHILSLTQKRKYTDTIKDYTLGKFPFWYYPDN